MTVTWQYRDAATAQRAAQRQAEYDRKNPAHPEGSTVPLFDAGGKEWGIDKNAPAITMADVDGFLQRWNQRFDPKRKFWQPATPDENLMKDMDSYRNLLSAYARDHGDVPSYFYPEKHVKLSEFGDYLTRFKGYLERQQTEKK